MIPRAHQSTDLSCPYWATISGARYSGVPQKVEASSSSLRILARPKSISFKYPSESIKMFSSFKSQWRIPEACKCPIPKAI